MTLYEILGSVETGLVFALVAMGAFITFKVLDFPDLTVEGSFPLGAAVSATLIVNFDVNPWVSVAGAGIIGFCAGYATAWLNVKVGILHILAGILIAIALYSINLRIMSGPNKPLLNVETIYSGLEQSGVPYMWVGPIVLTIVVVIAYLGLTYFLNTSVGLAMRATGANPAMAEAAGTDIGKMKLYGVGLANFLTAIGGAMFAQLFGSADALMGIGVIIVGLASVIVGMSIFPSRSMFTALMACIFGAILYRLAVAFALNADFLGFEASDVQLVTAVIVIIALMIQKSGFSLWKKGSSK